MVNHGAGKSRHHPGSVAADRWESRHVHSIEEIWPVVDEIGMALEKAGYSARQVFAARLSLEEAISNGVRHGNRNDPRKAVRVRFRLDSRQLCAEVQDEGPGFDPGGVPDPLAPENIEREGGRGILLIRRYVTKAEYNSAGNCLQLVLERK